GCKVSTHSQIIFSKWGMPVLGGMTPVYDMLGISPIIPYLINGGFYHCLNSDFVHFKFFILLKIQRCKRFKQEIGGKYGCFRADSAAFIPRFIVYISMSLPGHPLYH